MPAVILGYLAIDGEGSEEDNCLWQLWTYCKWASSSCFHLSLGACREIKMAKAERDDSDNPCCPSCHVAIKPLT